LESSSRSAISDETTANWLAIPWCRQNRHRKTLSGCLPSDFESRSTVLEEPIWGIPAESKGSGQSDYGEIVRAGSLVAALLLWATYSCHAGRA
jgi:hypothetical protein